MKVLFNKLKRVNKISLVIFVLSIITYLISYIYFSTTLIKLVGIETIIRYIIIFIFLLYFLFLLISGLVTLIIKKRIKFSILMIVTFLLSFVFGLGSIYINKIYNKLDLSKDEINYTSNLIILKDREFNPDSKIGMLSDEENIEYNILANKIIDRENLDNEVVLYNDIYELLNSLYANEVDSIFVSGNYKILFGEDERYKDIGSNTKIIYTYEEARKNEDYNSTSKAKKLTEPFTILLMGVDSEFEGLKANQAFNGDTLMLITFNPKTLTMSMFSVPRDLYVPISCNNNRLAKINSSAAYGTNCVINTIKDLTDIDIDYYVKINFKGVVELVEALGGVTVDVGIDFCEQNSNREFGDKLICLNKGVQKLNGEQALAFARHRKTLVRGDIDRTQNQQKVVEAIFNEIKNISSFNEVEKILDAINNNIDTNISRNQILSLYNVAKDLLIKSLNGNNASLNIKKTYLEYYDLPIYLEGSHSTTSALGYYQESLDDITNMMKVNLGIIEEQPNKSYSIDYNEDYTSKFYGKNIRGDRYFKTMINLVGKSLSEAQSYAQSNGLELIVNEGYDPNVDNDIILDQSIHVNALLSNYNSLTVTINNLNKIEYNE